MASLVANEKLPPPPPPHPHVPPVRSLWKLYTYFIYDVSLLRFLKKGIVSILLQDSAKKIC
jgi:hypothetical protein